MHLLVDPDSLSSVLKICNRISDAKGFQPIYGYVKIEADEDGVLSFSVLDSYVRFIGRAEASEVKIPGIAVVETDRLVSIFKTRLGGHDTELKIQDNFLEIKQGEFRARLPLYQRNEFPEFDLELVSSYSIEVTPSLLVNLSRCADAVDTKGLGNDSFQGLLIDFEDTNKLWICGFSNSLVHVYNTDVEEHGGFRCVLAPSCLPILSYFSADVKTDIHFDLEHNKAVFQNPIISMSISFVEDKYPKDYVKLLGLKNMSKGEFCRSDNQELLKFIEMNTSDFLYALESASSVLGTEDKAIEFRREDKLDDGRGIVEMVGLNRMTQAKASEKILVLDELDYKLTLGLHSEKVESTISKFQSEKFKFFVGDAQTPIIVVEEGVPDFVAVTLPLRVS